MWHGRSVDFDCEDPVGGRSEVLCQEQPLRLGLPMHDASLRLFQPGSAHRLPSLRPLGLFDEDVYDTDHMTA